MKKKINVLVMIIIICVLTYKGYYPSPYLQSKHLLTTFVNTLGFHCPMYTKNIISLLM